MPLVSLTVTGGRAGEGRSLLEQRMTIKHTDTLTHSMTQHHFYSPWQPWASLLSLALCSTVCIRADDPV